MESLSSLQNYWLRRVKQVAVKLEKENIALLEEYNVLKVWFNCDLKHNF